MSKEELIKELEELRDIKNYSQSELMNTGYKTAILDALDLVNKYFDLDSVSGSDWEKELVDKNIHGVFTWCKDCGMEGCNTPLNDECGNCGSQNTVRYYDKETIDLLF